MSIKSVPIIRVGVPDLKRGPGHYPGTSLPGFAAALRAFAYATGIGVAEMLGRVALYMAGAVWWIE